MSSQAQVVIIIQSQDMWSTQNPPPQRRPWERPQWRYGRLCEDRHMGPCPRYNWSHIWIGEGGTLHWVVQSWSMIELLFLFLTFILFLLLIFPALCSFLVILCHWWWNEYTFQKCWQFVVFLLQSLHNETKPLLIHSFFRLPFLFSFFLFLLPIFSSVLSSFFIFYKFFSSSYL